MSCEDADAANDALIAALAGPKRVSSDAGEVEQHSVADIIKAIQFLNGQCAGSGPRRGIRFTKIKPEGTV